LNGHLHNEDGQKETLPCPCCQSRLCDADEEIVGITTVVPITDAVHQGSGYYLKCKVCGNIVCLRLQLDKCG